MYIGKEGKQMKSRKNQSIYQIETNKNRGRGKEGVGGIKRRREFEMTKLKGEKEKRIRRTSRNQRKCFMFVGCLAGKWQIKRFLSFISQTKHRNEEIYPKKSKQKQNEIRNNNNSNQEEGKQKRNDKNGGWSGRIKSEQQRTEKGGGGVAKHWPRY